VPKKKLREIACTVRFVMAVPILNQHSGFQPVGYGVRSESVSIPMNAGVRLAANLWMPAGANPSDKFPVLLEYLPYREDVPGGVRGSPRFLFHPKCSILNSQARRPAV
jgi:predicted acyl esterase